MKRQCFQSTVYVYFLLTNWAFNYIIQNKLCIGRGYLLDKLFVWKGLPAVYVLPIVIFHNLKKIKFILLSSTQMIWNVIVD